MYEGVQGFCQHTTAELLTPYLVAFTHLNLHSHFCLQAPAMEWNEGHTWTLNVQLPVGAVNFKVVMSEAHGGVRWEQGDNRSMLIPETTSVSGAPVGQVSHQATNTSVSAGEQPQLLLGRHSIWKTPYSAAVRDAQKCRVTLHICTFAYIRAQPGHACHTELAIVV
jgi:hypothetical protein